MIDKEDEKYKKYKKRVKIAKILTIVGSVLIFVVDVLLSNAIKYSPKGGSIYFDIACQNRVAIFRIQDEGIGIPKEMLGTNIPSITSK